MIHMTSTSGLIGNFGQANYMAAKMGIVGLSRGIALDMQRFNVRSNCIAPFAWSRMIGSIPTETDAEKQRVARLQQMTPEKIAPLVVYLGSDKAAGISGQIFSVRNNEIFLFNQTAADPLDPPRRRLDAGQARRAAQGRVRAVVHAARPLRRRVLLGPDARWRIDYDKLLALKIPDVEHTYTERTRCSTRSASASATIRSTEAQLDFVYEKNLKALPTFACVLGYPGFWVRDLDTGIDWVQDRQRRAGLHAASRRSSRAAPWSASTRIVEVIDKGEGKGAVVYTERKITDKASGELIATRDADHVLPRRRRLRRPAAREPAGASRSRSARPISSAICRRGRRWR